ncbi:MAG TPA: hypothetical protein DCG12_07955 [Planctomycetaceae bacterium]|nr:hypothetical protein [Planctomycetaceae bacterium]
MVCGKYGDFAARSSCIDSTALRSIYAKRGNPRFTWVGVIRRPERSQRGPTASSVGRFMNVCGKASVALKSECFSADRGFNSDDVPVPYVDLR